MKKIVLIVLLILAFLGVLIGLAAFLEDQK